MTVFVAHAPADSETAEGIEKFLERRGHFSEGDDGLTALRPVTGADVVVLLLSKDFVFAPGRLRLEQRALDAWAEGRLIVVKLDHAIAPVGLRDLPAIDASAVAQREFKWNDLADQISAKLRAPPRPGEEPAIESAPPPSKPMRKRAGAGGVLLTLLAMAPGLAALAVAVSIWLVNRIGPTPGTLGDLLHGIGAFGARFGLPNSATFVLFAGAIAMMIIAPLALVASRLRRPSQRAAPTRAEPENPPAPTAPGEEVFVSYARSNALDVLPVIEAAKQGGRTFWLDQESIGSGDSWAGEIVKAIRSAREVMVMCSKAAFESDHVKREIYLADRYRKKLVPVFIEDATPPEDFEYFFAGVQFLKLFETPEAERPAALVRALA